ncbi:MAG: SDR family oxidoreductase [Bacteroidia bacterium]|nr:SDR family oxidoreductase [Bacteroidia bacterium]MCF8425521.1 SDR family oxidoreductase [Bacteroidia bacterium]MCF8445834.1 SDR family oxidoreductase [Bacteroidia bacterium]
MSLKGKTVIITGASSGIGEACAYAFSAEGANLVLASRNNLLLEEISNRINHSGGNCISVKCDVRLEDDCKNLIEQAISKFHTIDVLVNNAGISMRATFQSLDLEVMKQLMQTNFWGSVYCAKFALPFLLKTKGSIIAVNSWAGFTGLPGRTGYTSSKFALLGFMESLRVENLKTGLHIGTIFPGYTKSNIRKTALNASGISQEESPLDESKLMAPEEVAKQIVLMVKKRRKYQVLTFTGKLMYWVNKLFPDYVDRQVYKVISKEQNSPFK